MAVGFQGILIVLDLADGEARLMLDHHLLSSCLTDLGCEIALSFQEKQWALWKLHVFELKAGLALLKDTTARRLALGHWRVRLHHC